MKKDLFSSSDEMYYEHPEFKKKTWKDLCDGWCHDEYSIKGFFGPYRFLSNFYLSYLEFDGISYVSSENAYQAAKVKPECRHHFSSMSPSDSKNDWKHYSPQYSPSKWDNDIKYHVMFSVLMSKFTQNEELRKKLIDTGDKYLEETNWWKDTYWGVCYDASQNNLVGKNNLGKLLMITRDILK